jgi:hypothetical protein
MEIMLQRVGIQKKYFENIQAAERNSGKKRE